MLNKLTKLFAILMVVALLAMTALPAFAAQANQNIIETLRADGRFNTLVNALQQANLVNTLETGGPYTIFAPTDDAFAKLPQTQWNNLMNDQQQLRNFLMYHVISDQVMADDLATMDTLDAASGESVAVTADADRLTVADIELVERDIEASNGVIHVVDDVLVAPSMASTFMVEEDVTQAPAQPDQAAQQDQTQEPQPQILPQTGAELSTTMVGVLGLAGLGLVFLAGGLTLGLRARKK